MNQSYDEWLRISSRIQSFPKSMSYYVEFSKMEGSSETNQVPNLCKEAKNLYELLNNYKSNFADQIVPQAHESIENFIKANKSYIECLDPQNNQRKNALKSLASSFPLLDAEVSYFLKDRSFKIRATVEVALHHLQRSIMVMESVREEWKFDGRHETLYEGLGSVHMLLHKIYAFKANSEGERTDLVISEQKVNIDGFLIKSVDGLVHTEWKKVKEKTDVEKKITEAIEQAKKYRRSSLYNFELSNYCYIILVSEKDLKITDISRQEGDTVYRIFNIITNPKTPSK